MSDKITQIVLKKRTMKCLMVHYSRVFYEAVIWKPRLNLLFLYLVPR